MSSELRKVLQDLPLPMDLAWSDELSKGNFGDALSKIDEILITEPTNLAARLWWVQCQSELGVVPASALNSPLEELLPKLKEANHLYESSIAAFIRVALRLLDRNQTKLAVVLIERAYEFSNLGRSIREDTKGLIRDSLEDALELERKRAELKREPKSYLDSIEKRIAEIKVAPKQKDSDRKKTSENLKADSHLSAASLLRDAIEDSKDKEPLGVPVTANLEEGISVDKHGRQAALITVCGLVMIVFGLYSSRIFKGSNERFTDLSAVSLYPTGYPELQTGGLPFAEAREVGLESVSKRLEKLRETKRITWNAEKSDESREVPRPTEIPTQTLSQDERAKLPEMNPEKLKTAVVESLGNTGAVNSVEKITRGPDGRIYGPPPTTNSVQPVEVETMKSPQLYRVIAPTSVFSAPSVIAQTVARLEAGAKIQVVAKLGKWLELRSSGGRRGYIYAQDAEKHHP